MSEYVSRDNDGIDVLRGINEIARFRGETPRRTQTLLTKGLIPGFKEGSLWRSTKSAQRADCDRKLAAQRSHLAETPGAER